MEKGTYPPSVNIRFTAEDKQNLEVIKKLLPHPSGMKMSNAVVIRTALAELAAKLKNEKSALK